MAKILVVDDDVQWTDSVKDLLEHKGHTTVTAHNGVDGVAMALSERPDLILLDVMMVTDSEGFEVARKLHEDESTRGIPIILITGIRRAKNLPFGFEPDADWLPVKAVLEKPVKPEALFKAVAEILK